MNVNNELQNSHSVIYDHWMCKYDLLHVLKLKYIHNFPQSL